MILSLGITPKNFAPLAVSYDADAQTFITAAGITDATQKSAVNQLVLDLKSASIWTKMKAIYPVLGGSASSHAVNLKTPGTYNLTFSTGWTHSSTGMTPNGATYANTYFNPFINISNVNSVSLSYYSRTNVNTDVYTMGADDGTYIFSLYANYSNLSYSNIYNGSNGRVTGSVSRGDGFFNGNRNALNVHNIWRNGTKLNTNTSSTSLGSTPNANIYIGGTKSTSPYIDSIKQCAFASIGDGLTDTEAANFYTAVQTYQTTLGRQV